jgi:hypothetical protein
MFNRWIEQNSNEFIGVLSSYVVRLQHQNDNLRYTFFINNKAVCFSSPIRHLTGQRFGDITLGNKLC